MSSLFINFEILVDNCIRTTTESGGGLILILYLQPVLYGSLNGITLLIFQTEIDSNFPTLISPYSFNLCRMVFYSCFLEIIYSYLFPTVFPDFFKIFYNMDSLHCDYNTRQFYLFRFRDITLVTYIGYLDLPTFHC